MLDKLWSVQKKSIFKPYRDLSESERVIYDIFLDFVKSIEVKDGKVVYQMITGDIFSA